MILYVSAGVGRTLRDIAEAEKLHSQAVAKEKKMGFIHVFTNKKYFRKATKEFQQLSLALARQDVDALVKEISTLKDLRLINMIISCTFRARMQGFMSAEQEVLNTLLTHQADELIDEISNAEILLKLNETLQEDAAIDSFCTNELDWLISARISKL